MPKNGLLITVPTLAAAACALCWLVPQRAFEASAETRVDFSVSKQLFDPEAFGDVRSKFSGGDFTPSQATIEGRSVGRAAEPTQIPLQIKGPSPADSQCEPRPSARKFEPQYG